MPETVLQLRVYELRQEVAFFLGKGRIWNDIPEDEQQSINAIIEAGLRMFYGAYPWSFLHLSTSTTFGQGVWKCDLPDDFGFLNGDVSISDGTRSWPVRQVSQREIDIAKKDVQGIPRCYAVYPKPMTDDRLGQLWELAIWPVPSKELTLNYRYNVQPRTITDNQPYPYGGMYHSETIREACLAKAESETDDQPGVHSQHYQAALQNSIAFDKEQSTPDSLGYNGDGKRIPPDKRRIFMSVNGVDINTPTPVIVQEPLVWE